MYPIEIVEILFWKKIVCVLGIFEIFKDYEKVTSGCYAVRTAFICVSVSAIQNFNMKRFRFYFSLRDVDPELFCALRFLFCFALAFSSTFA